MLTDLLDTHIVIYVLKQRPPEVREVFNRNQGRMAISAITRAELVHGAAKSQFPRRNLGVIEDFFEPTIGSRISGRSSPSLWIDSRRAGTTRPYRWRQRPSHRRARAQPRAQAGDKQPRRVRTRTGLAGGELAGPNQTATLITLHKPAPDSIRTWNL